jgi:hypothetical protein
LLAGDTAAVAAMFGLLFTAIRLCIECPRPPLLIGQMLYHVRAIASLSLIGILRGGLAFDKCTRE